MRIKNTSGSDVTTYTYNTNARLSQLLVKSTNGVDTKYVYGLGLIGGESAGVFKTYHFDYRGSTVAITDANCNVTDTFKYDTYGNIISQTGASDVLFKYNGRDGVVTDSNGLIYMRARYYSPDMHRFVNADILHGEISDSTSLNRYAYVNGNPVSFVDPFGLSKERCVQQLSSCLDLILSNLSLGSGYKNSYTNGTLNFYYEVDVALGIGPIQISKTFNEQDILRQHLDIIDSITFSEESIEVELSKGFVISLKYTDRINENTEMSALYYFELFGGVGAEYTLTTKDKNLRTFTTTFGMETLEVQQPPTHSYNFETYPAFDFSPQSSWEESYSNSYNNIASGLGVESSMFLALFMIAISFA